MALAMAQTGASYYRGNHVLQTRPQETLNFAIHIVDHPPLPSSVARTAGQGQSLTEYVTRRRDVLGNGRGSWPPDVSGLPEVKLGMGKQ